MIDFFSQVVFCFLWVWGLASRFEQLIYARKAKQDEGVYSILFLVYMHTIFSVGQGFFTFVLYGLSKEVLDKWKDLLTCAFCRKKPKTITAIDESSKELLVIPLNVNS